MAIVSQLEIIAYLEATATYLIATHNPVKKVVGLPSRDHWELTPELSNRTTETTEMILRQLEESNLFFTSPTEGWEFGGSGGIRTRVLVVQHN